MTLETSGLHEYGTLILGISVLLSNIGARYIFEDLNERYKRRHQILSHPVMKYIYVFAIGLGGSRNIKLAAIITLLYAVFINMTDEPANNLQHSPASTATANKK